MVWILRMKELLKEKKYIVLKNLLNKDFVDLLENTFSSNLFPWYFYDNTVTKDYESKEVKIFEIKDYLMFTHSFFLYNTEKHITESNSSYGYIIADILKEFKKKLNLKNNLEILRAKINFQTQYQNNKKNNINSPHYDFQVTEHYVILYYVNDSDGDTHLFDNEGNLMESVNPQKGSFLIFDGNTLHAGSNPINSKKRLIINIDIKK